MNILESVFRSAENPQSPLSNPANWLIDWMGGTSASGEQVTPETSLTLPAVWSAVTVLSQTVASLPLNVYQRIPEGKRLLPQHPLFPLLHDKPHEMLTSYYWKQLAMAHCALWGNHYSLIQRANARATGLIPFHPSQVDIKWERDRYWYIFKQKGADPIVVDKTDVIHIKGLGFDGIQGRSVIAKMKDNIGLGISAQKSGAKFYANGMQLDGVITHPNSMTKEGLTNLRNSWNKTYTGPDGQRVAVLDSGMDYKAIGIPMEDAQFIETRKFSVTDIARMFRVPPPMIYDLEKANYANINELVLNFVKFSITPWLMNIEQELNDKLFFESEKGTNFAEFNLDGLLRGDIEQRSEFYKTMTMIGAMNANEVRNKENFNPYEGGEKYFVQANMQDVNQPPSEE